MMLLNTQLIPTLMALVSSLALWLIHLYPLRPVFFLVAAFWLLFIGLTAWFIERLHRGEQWVLWIILTTSLSLLGLLTLIEWPLLRYFIIILGGVGVGLLFRSIMTAHAAPAHIQQKPYRRLLMLLLVFDAYALVSTIFALSQFFPALPFWFLALASAALYAGLSLIIWRMYYTVTLRQLWLWLSIIFILTFEVTWVVNLLPLGYLVAGFLVTWWWYLLQLFIRFHFGPTGVIWQKQRWFLLGNTLLYALALLIFVRWI